MGTPDFREERVEKQGQNWKSCHFFSGKSGIIVRILPWKDKTPIFRRTLYPNFPSFYLKCNRKYKKNYRFWHFVQHFPQSATFSSQILGKTLNFIAPPPKCILLKFHYPKHGVYNLRFSNVIAEKPLPTPSPLLTERLLKGLGLSFVTVRNRTLKG